VEKVEGWKPETSMLREALNKFRTQESGFHPSTLKDNEKKLLCFEIRIVKINN